MTALWLYIRERYSAEGPALRWFVVRADLLHAVLVA